MEKILNMYLEDINLTREELAAEGLKIGIKDGWRNEKVISVSFIDMFCNIMANPSEVRLQNASEVDKASKDRSKNIKNRIAYKKGQYRKLMPLQEESREKILNFISESFSINREVLTPEIVIFEKYQRFTIKGCDFSFSFEGKVSYLSFDIHVHAHGNPIKSIALAQRQLAETYSGVVFDSTSISKELAV